MSAVQCQKTYILDKRARTRREVVYDILKSGDTGPAAYVAHHAADVDIFTDIEMTDKRLPLRFRFQYAYDGEECEADTAQSCQYTCRYKVDFVYVCHFKKADRNRQSSAVNTASRESGLLV